MLRWPYASRTTICISRASDGVSSPGQTEVGKMLGSRIAQSTAQQRSRFVGY